MKDLNSSNAPAAIGPYVQAKDLGQFVFTSGQLPINPATGEMPATASEQTSQSLANVAAILAEAGLTAAHIVKTTVFVKDLNHFAEVNEAYSRFFAGSGSFPARSCVEVARLPKDAMVEIEVIAMRS
jgi:2-iminobutanoate/2-iminopropanoate deaminase